MAMWLAGEIIKKYESGTDWKYDLDILLGAAEKERRIRSRNMPLHAEAYMACGKRELLEEIRFLEEKGLIRNTKWQSYGNDATQISYALEDMEKFYELEGRTPKPRLVKNYLENVDNRMKNAHQLWILRFLEEEKSQAMKGKLPKEMERQEEFLDCLLGVDALTEPVYKRVFSKACLRNSKKFEREYEKKILSAARKYHDGIEEGMSDPQVLSELFIEEYAQELALKGPLHLLLDGKELQLEDFHYGTVLNSETLKRAQILKEQPIDRIVTVENKANFVSMPYQEGTLILFCHGFFSPGEREFLQKLAGVMEEQEGHTGRKTEYLHTGDLDYGGIRIFQHIRKRIFPGLRPLRMDEKTYLEYREYGEAMGAETLEKLRTLEEPALEGLIACMLREGYALEQEAFLIR